MDAQAIEHLKRRGFKMTRGWSWRHPDTAHHCSARDIDAVVYLFEEWDFCGLWPTSKMFWEKPEFTEADFIQAFNEAPKWEESRQPDGQWASDIDYEPTEFL